MVVLTEQIEIPASYEKMEAWTANFEEEFVKWSPYHIECNLYNGNYNAGSKIRFREIVMGLDYDVTGTITECEQDENHFRIVFRSDKKTAFITFEGKRTKTGCHFLSHRGFRHDHAGNWGDHELPDLQGVFQEKGKLAAYPG